MTNKDRFLRWIDGQIEIDREFGYTPRVAALEQCREAHIDWKDQIKTTSSEFISYLDEEMNKAIVKVSSTPSATPARFQAVEKKFIIIAIREKFLQLINTQ